jgi:hypothetical protein
VTLPKDNIKYQPSFRKDRIHILDMEYLHCTVFCDRLPRSIADINDEVFCGVIEMEEFDGRENCGTEMGKNGISKILILI